MANVDVQFACDGGELPDAESIRHWVRAALLGADAGGPHEVSVRVVGEAEGRRLNAEYRGRDAATNVLSFPAPALAAPDREARHLGDIVVCGPVVARESDSAGRRPTDHWAHLVVHGTLHLLGYDHETGPEAAIMEALETRILGRLGIADPYAN